MGTESTDRAPLRLELPEPTPLRWPGRRELNLAGKGRRLLSLAVRSRGEQRAAVLRDAAFKAVGNITPSFAVETDGVRVYVDTSDQEISRLVYIFGLYDKPLMTLAFSALRQLGGPADLDGRHLLDLGANIGTTTLTAVACFRAQGSYAFEPDPINFRNLSVNVAANRLGERAHAFELALSDEAGTVTFERSEWNAGDHRVRSSEGASADAFDESGRELIEVRSARLDELIEAGEVDLDRIGAVWIDVQGHEGHLLAGAERLLERAIPMVAEYWPYGLRAAGGHERFHELLAGAYAGWIDLGGPEGRPRPDVLPIEEIRALDSKLTGADDHSDLLLLPAELVRGRL
jgi:FkbM family methyltransferase